MSRLSSPVPLAPETGGLRDLDTDTLERWDDGAVNDYLVATHAEKRNESLVPEGKCHAYLAGARITACGFGLDAMRRFADVHFSMQPPAARCPLCARVVGSDH